jgi:hypothetical protein
MADLRFAVVLGEFFLGEDVFPVGPGFIQSTRVLLEGVNGQCALDLDRILFVLFVEHQPASEAALRRLAGLIHDRVGPQRHDLRGRTRLVVRERPEGRRLELQRRAAGRRTNSEKKNRK